MNNKLTIAYTQRQFLLSMIENGGFARMLVLIGQFLVSQQKQDRRYSKTDPFFMVSHNCSTGQIEIQRANWDILQDSFLASIRFIRLLCMVKNPLRDVVENANVYRGAHAIFLLHDRQYGGRLSCVKTKEMI